MHLLLLTFDCGTVYIFPIWFLTLVVETKYKDDRMVFYASMILPCTQL